MKKTLFSIMFAASALLGLTAPAQAASANAVHNYFKSAGIDVTIDDDGDLAVYSPDYIIFLKAYDADNSHLSFSDSTSQIHRISFILGTTAKLSKGEATAARINQYNIDKIFKMNQVDNGHIVISFYATSLEKAPDQYVYHVTTFIVAAMMQSMEQFLSEAR